MPGQKHFCFMAHFHVCSSNSSNQPLPSLRRLLKTWKLTLNYTGIELAFQFLSSFQNSHFMYIIAASSPVLACGHWIYISFYSFSTPIWSQVNANCTMLFLTAISWPNYPPKKWILSPSSWLSLLHTLSWDWQVLAPGCTEVCRMHCSQVMFYNQINICQQQQEKTGHS